MTEETGAAAPAEQAVTAPAESEPAKTTETGVQQDAAQAETKAKEPDTEVDTEGDDSAEDKPRKLSRSERQRRRLKALHTEVEALRAQLAEKGDAKASNPPKEEDFNGDYLKYQAALAAHETSEAVRKEFQERDRENREREIQARQREAAEEFFERAEELKARVPDFDEAIEGFARLGGKFEPHVIEELQFSEYGPLLAYQLAKNPQKAAELNAMSARDAAREIGRLEAKVTLPQPKKQTQAPPPIKPPSGGASPKPDIFKLAESEDITEFVKVERQRKKERGA
jgi:hypothetical protein